MPSKDKTKTGVIVMDHCKFVHLSNCILTHSLFPVRYRVGYLASAGHSTFVSGR